MTFQEFTAKYRKGYVPNTAEYDRRQALFEARRREIDRHNCGDQPWTAGINHLADWTQGELAALRGYRGERKQDQSLLGRNYYSPSLNSKRRSRELPSSFNWTHLKAVQETRDQGQCGSCWAFAAEQVLRAHAEIKGWPSRFSVSQIISCTPNPRACGGTGGCAGATAELAFDYALRAGLVSEDLMPYPEGGGEVECPAQMQSTPALQDGILELDGSEVHMLSTLSMASTARGRDIGMLGWTKFPENREEHMVRALVEEGPLAVAVAAGNQWNWYFQGIMLPTGCDLKMVISHAVVLFGYGVEGRKKFWHIKNSWGTDWGESGNLRLQRLDQEESYCGWDNQPEVGSGCKGGPDRVWVCGSCGILYDTVMPYFADKKRSVLATSMRAERRGTEVEVVGAV